MANRNTLSTKAIDNFKSWLVAKGWQIQEPKGDYEGRGMKIGTKVHCTKYVERRRNGFTVVDCSPFDSCFDEEYPREVIYYDTEKRETVYIPYKEFTDATIDKFKTIEKEFEGIYVGTTHLSTKLTATYEEWGGGGNISFRSNDIKKFAIVYYANNRKRLVPIDCLKESGDTE